MQVKRKNHIADVNNMVWLRRFVSDVNWEQRALESKNRVSPVCARQCLIPARKKHFD